MMKNKANSERFSSVTKTSFIWGFSSLLIAAPLSAKVVGVKTTNPQEVLQSKTVSGQVLDEKGEPMIGVNVLVKGTTNGTITDFDGKFSIPDVPSNATLVVSYIGYLTKEVKTGKDLVIVLEEDNKTLDEVVVIGYGTVKRRDLTGSVASVTGEKLAANPVANVAQALQGQLPGVSVTSQDGRPGAGMSIRIRGGGSITQSNDPLFIVDGVQVSGIDDIPADNIESIDVLKDAASTAIYGARGANGVILVTTKGGKDGRVSVKYNMYYQMKENPKLLETMDPYDYVYNTWAYMKSLGDSYGDGVARYFGLGSKYGNHLNEYKNMTTHNYINDLMQTASSWNHDVSLSGGTDKTKFYSSVNYMDDEGIRVKSGFQRWNANFKLTQKINKKLTADFDLRYSEIEVNGSGFGNATSAYTYRPVDNPLGDASFTAGFGQGDTNMEETSNPLYYLNTVDYIKNMYRIRAKGALTWNIIKGLTAKTELSLNRNWNQEKTWDAGQTEKDNSSAKLKKSDGYGVRWATTLNYEVQGLGDDHNLSFLVGNEVLASKSDYTEIYGVGYPKGFTMDDAFGMINMTTPSLGQDYFKGEIGTPNHTLSWFGRANYSYKGKYLLEANFRADASSRFAKGYRWGYFPSFSAGWRISEEDFMENTHGWLQSLKLRGSWGLLGNQDAVSDEYYPYLPTLYIGKNFPFGGSVHQGITVVSHKVTTISWENSTNWGIGFDANFLNEFMLSAEYYNRKTSDIIMDIPVSDTFGISGTYQDNKGSLRNSGVEASFAWNHSFNKDWRMGINTNFSYNKNELLDLAGVNEIIDGYMINRIGEPYQSFYVYEVDGLFKSDEEAAAYEKQYGNPWSLPFKGGDFRIKDADGDGKLTDKDRVGKGTQQPKTTFGLTLSAGWKNFDLSVFMQGVTGTNRYFSRDVVGSFIGDTSHPSTNWLDAWTPENTNAEWPRLFLEENSISSPQRVNSSFWCMNTNYLRIKNVNLGYTLPKSWTNKLGIANAKIYYTGENLFTFDSLPFNADPESPSGNLDVYPISRSHSFGINVTF